MPAINTRGAMSARGFGFGATSAVDGYKWMTQTTLGNTLNYSNTTLVPQTGSITLPFTAWSSTDSQTFAGLVTSGPCIATPNSYSSNKGATWINLLAYNQSYNNAYVASGPNNNVAMDPVSGAAMGGGNAASKSGYVHYLWYRSPTSGTSFTTPYNPTNYPIRQFIYWPAASRFYITFSGINVIRMISSTGTDLGYTTNPVGNPGNQKMCISPDGLTMYFSANTYIYSTTTYDFSSTTSLGYNTYNSYTYQGSPIKGFGDYWYMAIAVSNSLQIYKSGNTTDPTNWSYVGQANPGWSTAYGKIQLYYDTTNNTMYLVGNGFGILGKSYTNFFWAWSSTDAVTWTTATTGWMAIARNYKI